MIFLYTKIEPRSKIKKIKNFEDKRDGASTSQNGGVGYIVRKCLIIRLFCEQNGHLTAKYSLFCTFTAFLCNSLEVQN